MPRFKAGNTRAKNPVKTFKRLFAMVFKEHKIVLCVVLVSIFLVAFTFMQSIIDDYISPLIGNPNPDYAPLMHAIMTFLIIIVCCQVIPQYIQQRIMIKVSQGAMLTMRKNMFRKLESLPISYFDRHQHGETMSRFSNDTDTLNQMMSQALVQVMSAIITILFLFTTMLLNSVLLSVVVVFFIFLMFRVSAVVAGKSGKYFAVQQGDLADVNGFIEEMINGQKVIKVFTHEEESKKDFDRFNDLIAGYDIYAWYGHYHTNYFYSYTAEDIAAGRTKAASFESHIVVRCAGALSVDKELSSDGVPRGFVVTDIDGNRYEIPDFYKLSVLERKKLDLFI